MSSSGKKEKDEQIKASTPGLDAMAERQNEPIEASTPGLDAMAERDRDGQTLTQSLEQKRKAKEEAEAQKREDNKARAAQNRDARKLLRGLRRAEITGRVNQFVRDWASQNAAVNRAVNARGQTVNVAELPGVGTLDLGTGKLIDEPLFKAPTSSVEIPPEGGGGASCIGLGLEVRTVGNSDPPVYQIWANPGTINGDTPPGMDSQEGKLVATGGSGQVWAEVEVNQETGEVTGVDLDSGSSTPENSDDKYYYALGNYEFPGGDDPPTVTNYGCGTIDVRVCRNWFAAESPYYGVTLTRCGCGGYG
jgi:hypothetical protein